jgi:hypothetical protein
LTDVSHRREERRPQIEALETHDAGGGIDRYVKDLARRKGFEVSGLLFNSPHLIDRGVDPLRSHNFENLNDASSVRRHGFPHLHALHDAPIVATGRNTSRKVAKVFRRVQILRNPSALLANERDGCGAATGDLQLWSGAA